MHGLGRGFRDALVLSTSRTKNHGRALQATRYDAGGCGARAVLLASQKSEARGEWRSERSERAKLTSPPRRPRVSGARQYHGRARQAVRYGALYYLANPKDWQGSS